MKTINKTVFSVVTVCFALALTSCASVDTLNTEATSWVGKPVADLIAKLGPAHSGEELSDGTTVRQWVADGGKSIIHRTLGSTLTRVSIASGTRTCVFNVISRDETITKLFYRVQHDTLAGHARKECGYFRKVLKE